MSNKMHTISSSTRNKGAKQRMGSKSKILRAVATHLAESGPLTVHQIVEKAVFKNGKSIKNSNSFRSTTSLGMLMYRHSDFFTYGKDTRANICIWDVKQDSDFLNKEIYKQRSD